jgi:hypothetical protein
MALTGVKASERFDNAAFENVVEDGMARPLHATYTCPRCGERLGFQKRNFENARRRPHTNLSPEVASCFDEFARSHVGCGRDYLDWLCPKCRLAARVFIEFWAGGRHGHNGFNLITIIEGMPQ